jgi:hypothetical protein
MLASNLVTIGIVLSLTTSPALASSANCVYAGKSFSAGALVWATSNGPAQRCSGNGSWTQERAGRPGKEKQRRPAKDAAQRDATKDKALGASVVLSLLGKHGVASKDATKGDASKPLGPSVVLSLLGKQGVPAKDAAKANASKASGSANGLKLLENLVGMQFR